MKKTYEELEHEASILRGAILKIASHRIKYEFYNWDMALVEIAETALITTQPVFDSATIPIEFGIKF